MTNEKTIALSNAVMNDPYHISDTKLFGKETGGFGFDW